MKRLNFKTEGLGWNVIIFLLSSVAIGMVSLYLAIGDFSVYIFIDFFRCVPITILLNVLPVVLLQLVFLCIFNRQWAAFLLNALIILGASIGNYYKLRWRSEPFIFTDISAIGAGLRIAGNYDMSFNGRIWLALFGTVFGTIFLFFLAKRKMRARFRISLLLLCALSVAPLWHFVYSDEEIYEVRTANFDNISDHWAAQIFASKGFVYPFIYSIHDNPYTPPKGYDEKQAAAWLSEYSDSDIPSDRRVNVMVIQLETFVDLESVGFSGIDPEAYRIYHEICEESISGRLITNVFGGGTLNSEQCVMTGNYVMPVFRENTYSYVWYMAEQGYSTSGTHPWEKTFYNRLTNNPYLGFQDYIYYEDYFESRMEGLEDQQNSDFLFFPQLVDEFRRRTAEGEDVFSFSVSMQGHTPFVRDAFLGETEFWSGEGHEQGTRNVINNFLWLNYDTQIHLKAMLEELRHDEEPVVLLLYGDHMPALRDHTGDIYKKLNVNFNQSTEEGFYNHNSTPYIIWANEAAKEQLDNDFVGEGEDTSVGYLMNILFKELGWEGPAKMKFTEEIRKTLPVLNCYDSYMENGRYTRQLSEEGQELLRRYDWVKYYLEEKSR